LLSPFLGVEWFLISTSTRHRALTARFKDFVTHL
jgi:hypothetical protein